MNRPTRLLTAALVVGTLCSACSGAEDSGAASAALTAAYEECTGYAVVLSDGEFEAPDGDSGVGDHGRTVWSDQGGGQCVADTLSWPTRIEKAVRMGTSGRDSWGRYRLTWDWEDPMGTGLSMVISTDSGAAPDTAEGGASTLADACRELGNGNLAAAEVHADRASDSGANGDLAEHLRELSMMWEWYESGPGPALGGGVLVGTRDEYVARVLEEQLEPTWEACAEHVDDGARFDHERLAAAFTTIAGTAWDRQGEPPLAANLEGRSLDLPLTAPTDVDGWIHALAGNHPRTIGDALEMTEPGSPAASYLLFRSVVTEHAPEHPDDVLPAGDGYDLCDRDHSCLEVSDIEQRAGLVSSFSLEGEPVEELVTGRSAAPVSVEDVAVVHRVLAYKSPLSGSLWVVVRLENTDLRTDLDITRFEGSYTGGGAAQGAGRVYGPRSVPPGSGGYYVVEFPDSELGGAATVAVLKPSGSGWTVELDVPRVG